MRFDLSEKRELSGHTMTSKKGASGEALGRAGGKEKDDPVEGS